MFPILKNRSCPSKFSTHSCQALPVTSLSLVGLKGSILKSLVTKLTLILSFRSMALFFIFQLSLSCCFGISSIFLFFCCLLLVYFVLSFLFFLYSDSLITLFYHFFSSLPSGIQFILVANVMTQKLCVLHV